MVLSHLFSMVESSFSSLWLMHGQIMSRGNSTGVMNIEWDYSYYQPWSDNEWLVEEMIAMREETLMEQNEDITIQ